MNSVPLYAPLFLSGLAVGAVFFFWRKASARWSTWFPVLKKTLEWTFIGAGAGAALWGLFYALDAPGLAPGPALLAAALGIVLPEGLLRLRGRSGEKEETKRGAAMGHNRNIVRRIKNAKVPTYLEIADIPVPVSAEPYHFLVAGSTGTGKSVVIGTLLQKIRARGDTAIVVDSGGNFLEKHFDSQTDFVFNPYDSRCVGWSPTAEMQGVWDAQALARSIVPDGVGDSKEWNSYAQTFVASVLRKLWEQQRLTMRDFLYFVQAAPRSELQELLADTPAAGQLGSERTFGSIRTIAGNYVTSYDYLPTDQGKFSVTEMIRAEHSGVLFLTYRDDQLDSLRNLMACLLDVAARTILSLEPNPERRVWLIIDEFASLGRVQSIEAVATKARKNGGCLVLGIQSVSQLRDRYGDNGAQTILSCLSTWLVLRCSDADTAEYMSKYIGEAEIRRTQKGQSASDTGETQSWNEQSAVQRVVLGSQIQAFPNLSGLLKLAGDYPVCEVKLALPKPIENQGGAAFQARNFSVRPPLHLTAAKPAKKASSPGAPAAAAQTSAVSLSTQGADDALPRATQPTPAVAAAPAAIGQDELPSGPIPGYSDRTPRPQRPKNLLVEVSRGLKTLPQRLAQLPPQTAVAAATAVQAKLPAATDEGASGGQLKVTVQGSGDAGGAALELTLRAEQIPGQTKVTSQQQPTGAEASVQTPAAAKKKKKRRRMGHDRDDLQGLLR